MKTEPLVLKEKTEIQVLRDRKCRFVSTRLECMRTNCVSDPSVGTSRVQVKKLASSTVALL